MSRLLRKPARNWKPVDTSAFVGVPTGASLIYTDRSGGKLFQGGNDSIPKAKRLGIDTVVLAAYEHQPSLDPDLDVIRVHMDDDYPSTQFLPTFTRVVSEVAGLVSDRVRTGRRVLVTCWQGRNRSGIVTAIALRKLTDMSGSAAIHTLRRRRGPGVLTNSAFAEIVKTWPKTPDPSSWAGVDFSPFGW